MSIELQQKIESRNACIGIIGLGYVGLPLALTTSEAGYANVIGFDLDSKKVEQLTNNESYIKHIDLQRILAANTRGLLATTDFAKVLDVDVLIICVPTPLNKHHEPDLHFIRDTLASIAPYLHKGMLISLESTTYPGTTEEEIVPLVQQAGFNIGEDFHIVYSPEREDPGNLQYPTHKIPKICGGITPDCCAMGQIFYGSIVDTVVPVSSTKAAEMTKLLENIHRAVNIGLVNEMKMVADKMGINIHEVIDAAATKPFGFTKYTPGPGLGGHCIPIDPFYLTWKAKEYGINTRFIELSGEINRAMPEWVVGKLMDALNERGKPLKGSKILVLGIAYKKNIDDARESPAVRIMELLRDKGAEVSYSDPHIPSFPKMRDHTFDLTSLDLTAEELSKQDACIVATDHSAFNWELISKKSRLVIDCKNKYSVKSSNIIHA